MSFKKNYLSLVLLSLIVSLMISCASTPAEPKVVLPTLAGTIVSIDKYGNIMTDIPTIMLEDAGYVLGDMIQFTIANEENQAPFVMTYSDVDRGNPLARDKNDLLMLATNYGNFAKKYSAVEGESVSIALANQASYKMELEIRHLEKSEIREDYESDQIFSNFRNVAFGSIAPDTLYRSCHPANDEARAPFTVAFVEEAGIHTVINLADNDEELLENSKRFPYYENLYKNGKVIGLDMGVDFADKEFSAKLKTGLEFLISSEGPYLIHCREGKDRAGMVTALLEALMGASVEEIIEDYMVTYENYYGISKEDPKYAIISKTIIGVLKDINGGKKATNDNIQKGAETYLINKIGLSADQVVQLKMSIGS